MDDTELRALLSELEHRGGGPAVTAPVARLGRAIIENSERLDKLEAQLAS